MGLCHPTVVVFLRVDGHDGAHAVVPEPAQLRASELVFAGLCRLEPNTDMHPGHSILFNPKRRDKERMDRILGGERGDGWPVHRYVQLTADGEVVTGAELSIGAGIGDVPLELLRGDPD